MMPATAATPRRLLHALALVVTCTTSGAVSGQVGTAVLGAGDAVLAALRIGDAEALEARFDDTLKAQLTHEKVVTMLATLQAQLGPLHECAEPVGSVRSPVTRVAYRCRFDHGAATVRLAFNDRMELAGLFFAPVAAAAEQSPVPAGARAEPVTTGAAGWPLPGTLLIPTTPPKPPVAVLVHGSGPNDRDETIGPNHPFRDLAEGLATRGVATLRYDKRTHVLGARMVAEKPDFTLDDEVVDDAVAALRLMAARADLGPVFVVGHSEGAWLAPRIAQRARDAGVAVAGVVLLAGNVTPLVDVLVYQYELAAAAPQPRATAADVATVVAQRDHVRSLVAAGRVLPGREDLPLGLPASAWLDIARYDPAATLLAQPTLPALLVFGERDYQVRLAEKDAWQRRLGDRAGTTIVAFPRLNHLLIEGDGPLGPEEYRRPGRVATALIDRVAAWIGEHPRPDR